MNEKGCPKGSLLDELSLGHPVELIGNLDMKVKFACQYFELHSF